MFYGGTELDGVLRRIEEASLRFDRWRRYAEWAGDEMDTTAFDEPAAQAAPDGAPAAYREVMDRIDAGEMSWAAVLTGTADDEDSRAVSVWMDRRLQEMTQVGRLVRAGVDIEDACREVTGGGPR